MQTPGLKGIVIRTFFSTMICCSVVSLLWLELVEISGRKTDLYGLGHVLLIFCSICMAISTLTIFFNKLEVVRTHPFLSLLSFFLLPVIVGVLLGTAIFEQQERRMFMVMLLSFLTPLVYYFIQYRKQLQQP
jgi:cytochrome bd-type quinol oxidase subunit 2